MKKRSLALLLAFVMMLALLPTAALAAEATPVSSSNINAQEYVNGRRWASTVKSYLCENSSGTLTRVEYTNNQIIVEDYNGQFQLQSSRTIPMELSVWGGFFAGKDYNFLVFGQNNEEENDSKEVIRIVKYSKDWQRLGAAGLYGANTTRPFDAGSARFAEYNGYLYVRTCHEMYTTSDGVNHQANVTINVRQSDMKITDSFTKIMNVRYGYVSHSFNQFILVDQNQNIITLDHGDADPTRSAVLLRYNAKAGQDSFMKEEMVPLGGNRYTYSYSNYTNIQYFPPAVQYNDTGAAVGGFAETSNGYVTAYNFDGTASNLGTAPRDVYLAFTDKKLSSTTTVKLSSGTDTSVPVLASTGLDGGYIMWNGRTSSNWYSSSIDNTLHYARYDASGKAGTVQTATAALSDCAPIVWNGKVVWYVTKSSVPTFYTLDSSGVTAHTAGVATAATPEPEKPATAAELGLKVTGWAKADVDKALAAGLYDEALGKDMTVGITRAQAAAVTVGLYEAMGGAAMPLKDNPFTDTNDPNVVKAYSLGLIDGNGTGLFAPDGPLNREAVAVMLAKVYRKLGGTIPAASAMKFADSAKISSWAKAEVSFMEAKGIVKGNGTNFNPQGPITGQEALILGLNMMNTLG